MVALSAPGDERSLPDAAQLVIDTAPPSAASVLRLDANPTSAVSVSSGASLSGTGSSGPLTLAAAGANYKVNFSKGGHDQLQVVAAVTLGLPACIWRGKQWQ
jgi:hypothetical protein